MFASTTQTQTSTRSICISTTKLTLSLFLLLTSSKVVHAQIYINEISSPTSSDWVELTVPPTATESAQLSEYKLVDSQNHEAQNLSGTLSPNGYITFPMGNLLNKDGDDVLLIKIETNEVIEKISYGHAGICAPKDNETIGKRPDATGNIVLFETSSKAQKNTQNEKACPTNTPSPTPTTTPTATPTPSPTQTPIQSTKKPTPTLAKTLKPTPNKTPQPQNIQNATTPEVLSDKSEQIEKPSKSIPQAAIIMALVGTLLLSIASYPLLKNAIKKYNEKHDQ